MSETTPTARTDWTRIREATSYGDGAEVERMKAERAAGEAASAKTYDEATEHRDRASQHARICKGMVAKLEEELRPVSARFELGVVNLLQVAQKNAHAAEMAARRAVVSAARLDLAPVEAAA